MCKGEIIYMEINEGGIYLSHDSYDREQCYIVTGIGISHVLYSPFPLVTFNGRFMENCITIEKFKDDFYLYEE